MWGLYLRYYTTEGADDHFTNERFQTLADAKERASDIVYEDFFEYERQPDYEDDYDEERFPRFPSNWETVPYGTEINDGHGQWYELPTTQNHQRGAEVPLVYAHLHTQNNWAFRDDRVLFFAKKL